MMRRCLELVEMEVRELLDTYEFDGDNSSVVQGSALKALEGDAGAVAAIKTLMEACDTEIPEPERDIDKPFLMPVEDVFSNYRSWYSSNWPYRAWCN